MQHHIAGDSALWLYMQIQMPLGDEGGSHSQSLTSSSISIMILTFALC